MPEGAERPNAGFSISPDKKFTAIAMNTVIRIYHVESNLPTAELGGHEDTIWAIDFWEFDQRGNMERASEARDVIKVLLLPLEGFSHCVQLRYALHSMLFMCCRGLIGSLKASDSIL